MRIVCLYEHVYERVCRSARVCMYERVREGLSVCG